MTSASSKILSRILMCRPTHFTVNYEINPWMKRDFEVDNALALRQWNSLKSILIDRCGAQVELLNPSPNCPDMVFTANAGLIRGNLAYLSHFKYKERQGERDLFKKWFIDNNFTVIGNGEHFFEGAGEAFFAGDKLLAAYGFRTDKEVYGDIQRQFEENGKKFAETIYCKLIDPRFYHLDTCFCLLDSNTALWFPYSMDLDSRVRLTSQLNLIPVPEKEALNFACNAVVVGKKVVTPIKCPETAKLLEKRGFETYQVDVSEFMKAGGACKCLTLAI